MAFDNILKYRIDSLNKLISCELPDVLRHTTGCYVRRQALNETPRS